MAGAGGGDLCYGGWLGQGRVAEAGGWGCGWDWWLELWLRPWLGLWLGLGLRLWLRLWLGLWLGAAAEAVAWAVAEVGAVAGWWLVAVAVTGGWGCGWGWASWLGLYFLVGAGGKVSESVNTSVKSLCGNSDPDFLRLFETWKSC